MKYARSNINAFNIGYHLIWRSKYRKKVLINEIKDRLKELLNNKAKEINIFLKEMEIMPDHLHLFVKAFPTISTHKIIQQFKGYTSRILRQEFKILRTRIPTLWTRSYYCESVTHISEQTIKTCIGNQTNK